ncbi:hypothetical protein GW835_00565 [archaeon]|nr:hypothetical protein [archaeon]NCP79048.1 hypothetical protein [archaeon]NCP97569.1 hypothetical protein [archaeon]NCQ06815.1 hypothetical protein [archaeon]NCQ50611.1 hypothetical protein [archaeon]
MTRNKEQDLLNEAIYDKGVTSLDDVKKEKPQKVKKKALGYDEGILDTVFKKKKVVKNQASARKEKKETSLGKKSINPFNIFKKKKKGVAFFNKL